MDKKRLSIILGSLVVLIILMVLPFSMYKSGNNINMAMEYISKNTLQTGKFVYRNSHKSKNNNILNSYNEVSHAGVLYSMYMLERVNNNYKLHSKRILASKFMFDNNIKRYKDGMWIAVTPDLSNSARLGSAGLALAALSNLYHEDPSYAEKLKGLGKFIVYMQKPDGSFYHKVNLNNDQADANSYVIYYPAEAALGLLYLNEVVPDKLWIETSKKALLNMVLSNHNMKRDFLYDAWSMIAIKKLFQTKNNTLTSEEHIILQKYVERSTKHILKLQITDKSDSMYGAFKRTTSIGNIALFYEGIAAAYYCTNNPKLQERIQTALGVGTKFLSKYQVKSGKNKGGVLSDVNWRKADNPEFSQICLDNVQHALLAWIMYANIVK